MADLLSASHNGSRLRGNQREGRASFRYLYLESVERISAGHKISISIRYWRRTSWLSVKDGRTSSPRNRPCVRIPPTPSPEASPLLRELHIQNLAVIQDATVEFHPGLNCFTGQTGAGKSLVIGALEILLALRQPSDMLRKGAPEGRVTAVFHINSENLRQELANATDLPLAAEPELIIARRIFESGRTSAS